MILCFDIGGSAIKSATATTPHDVRPLSRRPTPAHDRAAFVAALHAAIDEAGARPSAIAMSIAGVIDPKTGRATVANIPCLSGRPMAKDLADALGLPVLIANDADCFALAEATVGAGAGHPVVFGAILGTGVGGGLVSDGRLVSSAGGFSGEWGHGPVAKRMLTSLPDPLPAYPCGCGQVGCLDAICSARGLEKLYAHISGQEASSTQILEAWHAQEPAAQDTVAAWLELLSGPLAMVVNMTGATVVPTGGGLSNDRALVAALDAATRPLTLANPTEPLVVPALCRTEPGLIGAAILALQGSRRDAA